MKTILINGHDQGAWTEPLTSLGFSKYTNGVFDIYYLPSIDNLGIFVKKYPSNTNLADVGLYDISNSVAIDMSWDLDSANDCKISYERLKNGGLIMSCNVQNSSPYKFVAFIPVEDDTLSGYVVYNAIQSGIVGAKTAARVYCVGKSDFDSVNDVLLFEKTIVGIVNGSSIQMVNAYDYLNDKIIDNIYLTVSNPFSYSPGNPGSYKVIQVNDNKYFVIPSYSGSADAKLAFELAAENND